MRSRERGLGRAAFLPPSLGTTQSVACTPATRPGVAGVEPGCAGVDEPGFEPEPPPSPLPPPAPAGDDRGVAGERLDLGDADEPRRGTDRAYRSQWR